jgi:predicted RNase H-like HicB family nuclease
MMKFRAVVQTEPDGGLWAEVPRLPGCFTQASSPEELRERLAEAIRAYLGVDFDAAEPEGPDVWEIAV